MSKKIDPRLPREAGQGVLPDHAAIKSPWDKLLSYHDTARYACRYGAVFGAAAMQAYRIMIPDYEERSKAMCKNAYNRLYFLMHLPMVPEMQIASINAHPFFRGNYLGGLIGDKGDEELMMCGRVNDFGTYRCEKELDHCDWDIIGSELCRATTQSLQASADSCSEKFLPGPMLEYHMVEAKGCGDRHCRIVAENRDKYPMPSHEQWECFGPVATADQIRFTPEDECISESMIFREECNYTFNNGTCTEEGPESAYPMVSQANGSAYIFPTIEDHIKAGELDEKFADHVLKCVFEASGKALYGEKYAIEAFRNWVGAPRSISDDDGRLAGAHIEMYLQSIRVPYEIEAFNKDEVIYVIDRNTLANGMPRTILCYVSYWYGMTKTLVNAQWSLWEEANDTPADKLRIKIAKKVDKFC